MEERWTPAWGGTPPAIIPIPANPTPIKLKAAADVHGNASIASGEVDYYTFVALSTGSFRFSTSTPESGLDTVLAIYSRTGQRLAYNDDILSFFYTDSRVSLNLTAGTRYYLGITNYSSASSGSYLWLVHPAIDDALEENDSQAAAAVLGPIQGTKTFSKLVLDDADWFRFSLAQPGTSANFVQLNFDHSYGDVDLELYDVNGTRLFYSATTGDQETISLAGVAAGPYYLRAFGFFNATNPQYSLTIAAPEGTVTDGIDLRGLAVSIPDQTTWRQSISISATVWNAGDTAAGTFRTQFVLSRDSVASDDDIVLAQSGGATSTSFNRLGAGMTNTFYTSLTLPKARPADWTGTHFFIVMRTDSANEVAESNETNNGGEVGAGQDSQAVTVTAPGAGGGFQITLNITGMSASQRTLFQQAAERWSQVIIGDLPSAVYNGRQVDDVLIDASGESIDGVNGVLGQAGPDAFRASTRLPIHGVMEFDTADLTAMENNGTLRNVIIHEMGHVLGFGTIWSQRGLIAGAGTLSSRFTGVQATAEFNRAFGRNATGVPLETGGGPGTRDGHWSEDIFNAEIMTGYIESAGVTMPLSRITVASFADLGYQVRMSAADAFHPAIRASVQVAMAGGNTSGNSSVLNTQAARTMLAASTADASSARPHLREEIFANWPESG